MPPHRIVVYSGSDMPKDNSGVSKAHYHILNARAHSEVGPVQ